MVIITDAGKNPSVCVWLLTWWYHVRVHWRRVHNSPPLPLPQYEFYAGNYLHSSSGRTGPTQWTVMLAGLETCCPAAPPPSSLQLIPDYEALATELCSVFSVYFLIFCKLLKLNTTQPTSAIIFASSVCNYSSSQPRPNQLSFTLVILFICKVHLTFK